MAPAAMAESLPLPVTSHLHSASNPKSTVNASVLHGPGDVRLVNKTPPSYRRVFILRLTNSQETRIIENPSAGELQIQIKSTGICGLDVSYYKKFANACAPLSLGHDSSGVVVGIGPQVNGFSVGDRVALEVGIPCGQCTICRRGRYNLCKKMRFRSSAKSVPHLQETLQEKINHPAIWCHKW